MPSRSNTLYWEAPTFTFSSPNQADEWRTFYICAIYFLEALDINNETEDPRKKGWKTAEDDVQG